MTKKWERKDKNLFVFSVNNREIGSLHLQLTTMSQKALAKIEGKEFVIQRTGFWKNKVEILDELGNSIARVYSDKWYSRYYKLDYKFQTYRLLLRNNPLAEWVVLDGTNELMSYRLLNQKEADLTNIELKDQREKPDYLLDYLLWYLFVPIAHEYSGSDSSFICVIAAS
jgi:hypothetical protein